MTWLDDKGWSAPIRMSEAIEKKWWEQVPKGRKGVYRLIALAEANNNIMPAALRRVCGVDETGTLYIGASKQSLANRLGSLVMTHRSDFKGKPRAPLSKLLGERFPADKLAMSWKLTEKPWQREADLLRAYEEAFGELPPRNSQYPK